MSKIKSATKNLPVIVTTTHKGVFFGYTPPGDFTRDTIRIVDARMCVSWSSEIKGILGLASTGPSRSCRIGPRVPAITLRDVTAVTEVSEAAVEAWETAPWS